MDPCRHSFLSENPDTALPLPLFPQHRKRSFWVEMKMKAPVSSPLPPAPPGLGGQRRVLKSHKGTGHRRVEKEGGADGPAVVVPEAWNLEAQPPTGTGTGLQR